MDDKATPLKLTLAFCCAYTIPSYWLITSNSVGVWGYCIMLALAYVSCLVYYYYSFILKRSVLLKELDILEQKEIRKLIIDNDSKLYREVTEGCIIRYLDKSFLCVDGKVVMLGQGVDPVIMKSHMFTKGLLRSKESNTENPVILHAEGYSC